MRMNTYQKAVLVLFVLAIGVSVLTTDFELLDPEYAWMFNERRNFIRKITVSVMIGVLLFFWAELRKKRK